MFSVKFDRLDVQWLESANKADERHVQWLKSARADERHVEWFKSANKADERHVQWLKSAGNNPGSIDLDKKRSGVTNILLWTRYSVKEARKCV